MKRATGAPMALRLLLAPLACGGWMNPAAAGPPYVTDDPEPTDPGHWEIYGFVDGTHTGRETEGETGLDINFGVAKDLQLTAVVPLDYVRDGRTRAHVADVELAIKYLFIHQQANSLLPDVAFFPGLTFPTSGRRHGTGRVGLFLPLWGQKDIGKWSLFGGGGFTINPGPGQRDSWLQGVGASRELNERLEMGAEIYRQGRDAIDARAFTAVNVGASYRVSPHWSVLASAGPIIEHAHDQGRFTFYASIKADY